MDYCKTTYENLHVESYKDYQHVCCLHAGYHLKENEGQILFEQGLLEVLKNEQTFLDSTIEAKEKLKNLSIMYPKLRIASFINKYPCAYSVSCILLHVATKLDLSSAKFLFKNIFAVDNIRTSNLEKKLRLLGFLYFLKKDYFAPRGAIGTMRRRGSSGHAGHIFFITKDGQNRTEFPNPNNAWDDKQGNCEVFNNGSKWQIKDLAAENLHFFDHIYMQHQPIFTEGFWLPPGIYPLRRDSLL